MHVFGRHFNIEWKMYRSMKMRCDSHSLKTMVVFTWVPLIWMKFIRIEPKQCLPVVCFLSPLVTRFCCFFSPIGSHFFTPTKPHISFSYRESKFRDVGRSIPEARTPFKKRQSEKIKIKCVQREMLIEFVCLKFVFIHFVFVSFPFPSFVCWTVRKKYWIFLSLRSGLIFCFDH